MTRSNLLIPVAVFAFVSPAFAIDKADILDTYANIAAANHKDSLVTAHPLSNSWKAYKSEDSATWLKRAWSFENSNLFETHTTLIVITNTGACS